jgi:hypothetical protein
MAELYSIWQGFLWQKCTVYGRVFYGRNVQYMAWFGMAEMYSMYMAEFGIAEMYSICLGLVWQKCTVYGRVWHGRNVQYMAGFGMAEMYSIWQGLVWQKCTVQGASGIDARFSIQIYVNLHKTFKNNNRLMKLSGIVYLYLDFTFSG